jgi:proline iminopeptidase
MKYIILLAFYSAYSFSSPVIIPKESEYLGGRALCEQNAAFIGHEKGNFTKVPVDYKKPEGESFELYTWFQEGFNPELPTIVYLTGGPGLTSHWGQPALSGDFNVLLVDQRGIACSRPLSYETYLSPEFYSSKNIALDIEEVRKSLKIDKWTVYGVSYGTIPATIYASLFPKETRSLIIEGVAFDSVTLSNYDHTSALIKNLLDSQDLIVQQRLKDIENEGIDPIWVFNWMKQILLMNTGKSDLDRQLALIKDDTKYPNFLEMLRSQNAPQEGYPRNELYLMNEVPFYMLKCRETEFLMTPSVLTWDESKNIVSIIEPEAEDNCESIKAKPSTLYDGRSYPVKVPVFYFQGENDSATEAKGAYKHYENVAQGSKQFFLLLDGGHNPHFQILRGDNSAQKAILMNSIEGKVSTEEEVEKANSGLSYVKWCSSDKCLMTYFGVK